MIGTRIRPYIASDAAALADIFNRAVREIAARHYPPPQIAAWLDGGMEVEETHVRCSDGRLVLVTVDDEDTPVAFIDLEDDGHIDMLFVIPGHAGQGVASALYDELQKQASSRGLARLYVEASETSKPFFAGKGFALLHRRDFTQGGTPIHNYAMAKILSAGN